MNTQSKKLSFKNQKFFIGMDVHKRNWRITIRTEGLELRTLSINPSPKELHKYMKEHYPGGEYYSVYEAGFCGFWIHDELQKLGFHNIVINPADVPTSDKEKKTRTDVVDSRKLSRELENNSLVGIYIPDDFHRELREFCRLRSKITQAQTRVKNRIKGFLYFSGYSLPDDIVSSHWSGNFINWLKSIDLKYKPGNEYLAICIEQLQFYKQKLAYIIKTLRNYAKEYNLTDIDYIDSVSGISSISAITLYAEIINPDRFNSFDELASFVGLVPYLDASGEESDKTKGLTPRRNRFLRHILIEAAWHAVKTDPALTKAFNKYTKRMNKKKAIIRIAKKLLKRIRYVWKYKKTYETMKV